MDQAVLSSLRRSNLAHLLAISGLHMGLLTGFVFALVRGVLALLPRAALYLPTRKIAAPAALVAGLAYLALSGGAVATERAFVMAAVVFGAVLCDRRALTLRAVALAALIILVLQPEALLGPGFQMSFAATTALVLAFRWLSDKDMFGAPHWMRPVLAVFVSSAIAGAATAPIAAAHFNIISHFGLLANVLSVPVMGALVMPSAVLAGLLAPFGLAGPALAVMELGLTWILEVARRVSDLQGAVGHVAAPGPAVLPILALGALHLALWRGPERWAGAALCSVSAVLWLTAERPAMLVSPTGGLVGLMADGERVLSKPRDDGFVASSWLENDGDAASQSFAFERGAGDAMVLGAQKIVHLTGKSAREARCQDAQALLILNSEPAAPLECAAITPLTLRETGALAYTLNKGKLTRLTSREITGRRLWNDRAARARFQ